MLTGFYAFIDFLVSMIFFVFDTDFITLFNNSDEEKVTAYILLFSLIYFNIGPLINTGRF